jgi:carbonic anhydrase
MNRLASLAFAVTLLAPVSALPSDHPAHAAPSPDAVLKQLKDGNARFVAGKAAHPDGSVARRKDLAKGQNPKAVLGHHACGAVKATAESGGKAEGNIGAIVAEIAPAVEQAKAAPGKEGLLDDASHANARRAAAALTERSPVLKHLVEEGKLKIAVAVYDLASGKVEFE